MAGNDQNLKQRPTPKKVKTATKAAKAGGPRQYNGRANTAAGGYAAGGKSKPMFEGPSQILKDNRG